MSAKNRVCAQKKKIIIIKKTKKEWRIISENNYSESTMNYDKFQKREQMKSLKSALSWMNIKIKFFFCTIWKQCDSCDSICIILLHPLLDF